MIRGRVNAGLDATIPLVLLANGKRHAVEAVVDTGFNGFLTLPEAIVRNLNLPFESYGHARLADGTERLLSTYSTTIMWDRTEREVEVLQTKAETLIGMSLLQGYHVQMDVMDRGKVTMKRLVTARKRKKAKRR